MFQQPLKISICNETVRVLELTSGTIDSEQFDSNSTPASRVLPDQIVTFSTKKKTVFGLIPISGLKGSVEYKIGTSDADSQFILNWSVPVFGSINPGSFQLRTGPGWDAAIIQDPNNRGQILIRIRPSRPITVPDFHPSKSVWRFTNCWSNQLPVVTPGFLWNRIMDFLPYPFHFCKLPLGLENPLPMTKAHQGLCGGMVFATIDYHLAGRTPPQCQESPDHRDDPVFLFIKQRLWNSFDIPFGGWRYLLYSLPFYPNISRLGIFKGRTRISYVEEWPKIRADIDSGKLSPIGLVQTATFRISEDHQVLAYAYEQNGDQVTLWIYDPNEGPEEVTYRFPLDLKAPEVQFARTPPNRNRIWCFFRTNHYKPVCPPMLEKTGEGMG